MSVRSPVEFSGHISDDNQNLQESRYAVKDYFPKYDYFLLDFE